MTKKGLAKFPVAALAPEQLLLFEQCPQAQLIAHGRIAEHEGKEILLLHFFPRRQTGEDAKADFRVFISRDDYITQDLRCQGTKWKTGALDSIFPWNHKEWGAQWNEENRKCRLWTDVTILADAQTIDAIRHLAGGKPQDMLKSILKHQEHILEVRLEKKHEDIEAQIDAKMELFPDLPEDFNDWLQLEGFGKHRYLVYINRPERKMQHIRCNTCGGVFEIEKPRHNAESHCPLCGRKAVFNSIKKAQGTLEYDIQAAAILPYPGGFCVRYFTVRRDDRRLWELDGWDVKLREDYREIYVGGEREMFNFGKFLDSVVTRFRAKAPSSGYGQQQGRTRNFSRIVLRCRATFLASKRHFRRGGASGKFHGQSRAALCDFSSEE